jgi:predicted dehydrogenase
VQVLAALAAAKDVSLFTTWHAQFNAGVTSAAELLAGKRVAAMQIVWKEDVRKWHPGQQWIWKAGGFGVFDPGINALSIATRIFPAQLVLHTAELFVPANRQAPIAAELGFTSDAAEGALGALFDWRHSGGEAWTIAIETTDGRKLDLLEGGSRLIVDGTERKRSDTSEYGAIYASFVDLIDERRSLVDVEPLRLTADAFLVGSRSPVEAFED